jgi:hypothetical protein
MKTGVSALMHTYGQPAVGLNDFDERFSVELPGRLRAESARWLNGRNGPDCVEEPLVQSAVTDVGVVSRRGESKASPIEKKIWLGVRPPEVGAMSARAV